MTIVTLCLLAVLVAVELARLARDERDSRRPAIDAYVGRRVAVHRRGEDESVMGVLKEAAPDALVVVRASYVSRTASTPLDGEQVIERSRMDFFSVLDGGTE
jgi:hypothetical protein